MLENKGFWIVCLSFVFGLFLFLMITLMVVCRLKYMNTNKKVNTKLYSS